MCRKTEQCFNNAKTAINNQLFWKRLTPGERDVSTYECVVTVGSLGKSLPQMLKNFTPQTYCPTFETSAEIMFNSKA